MDYNKFFSEIGLCDEGISTFKKIHKRISDCNFKASLYEGYKAFKAGNDEFEKFVLSFAKKETLFPEELHLYLTVIYAEAAYDKICELGIDVKHFYASFKDVATNCAKTKEKTGIAGLEIFELPWFRYSLNAELYLLGRLQFQVAKSEYSIEIDGYTVNKGDTVLFVHVPGSEPLTEEACNASYLSALDFFGKHFKMDKLVCFCYSWLLQPWVAEILSPTSNIVKFQKTFKLIETIQSIPHTFRFIFKDQFENVEDYPTDNPLRRTAVARRKSGELVGYGVGVRVITKK